MMGMMAAFWRCILHGQASSVLSVLSMHAGRTLMMGMMAAFWGSSWGKLPPRYVVGQDPTNCLNTADQQALSSLGEQSAPS